MTERKKYEADKKLIQKLFGIEPLDWIRREDDTLVYITQAGHKFIIPPDELERLIEAWHTKDKVLQKAGLNPEKKAIKPAGVAPAAQVLGGAPPALGADAPTPASELD